MKKTLMTCMAIVALFAIAGSAGAITCTIDQRPAATLLVPYFVATFNADGSVLGTGDLARDTIVTIGNASSAPMIAHVNVFNRRSFLILDFNVALTGFDIQAMRISSVLSGVLPRTGYDYATGGPNLGGPLPLQDVCQRNGIANVYGTLPLAGGFLRVRPLNPATSQDNTLSTTLYQVPAYTIGSAFEYQVIDSLDQTADSLGCGTGAVDNVIQNPIEGYITIDHANYCNLSNPADPTNFYYLRDAIGMENNLWGEVIYTSGTGIPTNGVSTVNIEADVTLDGTGTTDAVPRRTFYRRYWSITGPPAETFCTNCGAPCPNVNFLNCVAPWNQGLGDLREPLGLKYAARYFEGAGVNSFFRVWRGGSGLTRDLTGPISSSTGLPLCTRTMPVVTLVFYDEDENTVTSGTCPSPCTQPSFNFPLETQRTAAATFSRPSGAIAGWVSMSFLGGSGFTNLDQAWVEYEFNGQAAFLSIGAPGTKLDPTTCVPLGVVGVVATAPVIPTIPTGTGP